MRWCAYLETLPPAESVALVNALTAAGGYASHAVCPQAAVNSAQGARPAPLRKVCGAVG